MEANLEVYSDGVWRSKAGPHGHASGTIPLDIISMPVKLYNDLNYMIIKLQDITGTVWNAA